MRDDFDAKTKRVLAARVGYRCSNPDCRKHTAGPQLRPDKAVNIGVAAHITAASPGGPRYDPTLSKEERKSAENGIWLCQDCAKLVDSDPEKYTVNILKQWKRRAEEKAYQEITGGSRQIEATNPIDTLRELLEVPENWIKVEGDDYIRHRYKPEFVIIKDAQVAEREFDEPWVKKFPNPKAWLVHIHYWYGATLLNKSPFIYVDGGRYLVPSPKIRNPFPDKDGWEHIQFVIDTSSIDWKTAQIFEQYMPLTEVLPKTGIRLE